MSKNNGENTTFDKLTPEQRRAIQAMGGRARGEACRRRKALKQVVLDLLDHPAVTESGKALIKLPDGEVPESLKAAIAASLIRQAMSGVDYSQGALYFMAKSAAEEHNVDWFESDLKYLFKYGYHEFYTVPDYVDMVKADVETGSEEPLA